MAKMPQAGSAGGLPLSKAMIGVVSTESFWWRGIHPSVAAVPLFPSKGKGAPVSNTTPIDTFSVGSLNA